MSADGRQAAIDAKNLRFYADMFDQYRWRTDVIHHSVFATTLREIADRIECAVVEVQPQPASGYAGNAASESLQYVWQPKNFPGGGNTDDAIWHLRNVVVDVERDLRALQRVVAGLAKRTRRM